MTYDLSRTFEMSFDGVGAATIRPSHHRGFGVLTRIDVRVELGQIAQEVRSALQRAVHRIAEERLAAVNSSRGHIPERQAFARGA